MHSGRKHWFPIVVNKKDKFDGWDVTKYLCYYARGMKINHILKAKMINIFEIALVLDIRNRVKELKTSYG